MLIKKFEEVVRDIPDKVAIKTEECYLTYDCLNKYANRLGRLILNIKKNRGQTLALLLGHDEKMIIGMIGVIKAGGVYIPFDPLYPLERLKYMLEDSASKVIITNREYFRLAAKLRDSLDEGISVINIDDVGESVPAENLEIKINPDKIAYILYTSGSTGRPKGVVQNQKNIFYYTFNWIERFSVTGSDRMTLFSSFCHDGSVPDIYSVLLSGATLYPYDIKSRANISKPEEWLMKERITIWHSVPTLYRYFVNTLTGNEKFYALRLIILGGEPVREHDLMTFKKYFPYSFFGNIYGQTESTVTSIWLFSQEDNFEEVIIGEPIGDTEILIIDEEGDEADELETGEIVVASPYVSPGYLNRVEVTSKVFTRDKEVGQLYWTGDLGRLLPDGNVEILGRKDLQVKIRGFRIEPQEIETVLLQHPDISETIVIAKETAEGRTPIRGSEDHYLCLYFVSKADFKAAELRAYLSGKLPYYMIPSRFVKLEAMPLLPNGKIDRKYLDLSGTRLGTGEAYVAPETDFEVQLTAIWKEILNLDRIGVNDNFFDLGATSMHVIRLNNKLKETLGIDVPMVSIYRYFSIKSFVRYLTGGEASIPIFEEVNDRLDKEIEKSKNRLKEKYKRTRSL